MGDDTTELVLEALSFVAMGRGEDAWKANKAYMHIQSKGMRSREDIEMAMCAIAPFTTDESPEGWIPIRAYEELRERLVGEIG